VVAKVKERLAMKEQRSHILYMERFNFKKLNEVDDKEKYHFKVSNRFAALEELKAEVDVSSVWQTMREYQHFSK
jgi:hypothetical protein